MINIGIIFPGYNNYSFDNLLYKLSNFNNIIFYFFNKSSNILKCDLLKLIKKNKIHNNHIMIQPAIATISIIIWSIIKNIINLNYNKINSIIMAGFSLGEYSALYCSNSINFYQLINLLKKRNILMNNFYLKKKMGMIIINGVKYTIINSICKNINKIKNEFISISIFNSEEIVTISGYYSSINIIVNLINSYNIKYKIILPFKKAYHSLLMKPIYNDFKKNIYNINIKFPKIPVISNIEGKILNSPNSIKQSLIKHIYYPIQWKKTIEFFEKNNINLLLEIGSKNIINFLSKTNIYNISCTSENKIIFLKKYLKNV